MAYNHFSYVPSSVTHDRSGFAFKKAIPHGAQLGWLYPMCKPVKMLPGSTLKLDFAAEVRSQALIAPLMDELCFDIFAFNVPNRIVWEHWKQYLGAVDDVLFDNLTEYQIPHFKYGMQIFDDESYNTNIDYFVSGQENYQWNQTLACHFELPYPKRDEGREGEEFSANEYVEISVLPFRGYDFIVNEYFLPEFCTDRILFSKTDNGYSGDNMMPLIRATNLNYWARWSTVKTLLPYTTNGDEVTVGGLCYPVSRAHRSLWTSCLPKPSLETLNLLGTVDNAPVGVVPTTNATLGSTIGIGGFVSGTVLTNGQFETAVSNALAGSPDIQAKISEAILTVNNYRETILLQNYYDALNRAGSRYDEIISNLFHTRTSMAVIDIPELIVHKRFTIYRKDVVSTADTSNKPLGAQAGYIDTVVRDSFFTKSTTEHGYIHMLFCIRPAFIRMTSGFEPDWLVFNKLDEFYPQFQGMGDVPRKKMEVAYGFSNYVNVDSKTSVLGYQEYSAEYKYTRNSAVGWFDPHTPNPLLGFTINDEFSNSENVSLNNYYLSCATEEVSFAKCLAITDPTVAPQFIVDIRLNGTIYHPMKVYNIPGQGDLL